MSGETRITDMAKQIREGMPINRSNFMRFFEWYHKTYIKPGRFTPVFHAMIAIGLMGYAIEYPHLKHEQEEARKKATEMTGMTIEEIDCKRRVKM